MTCSALADPAHSCGSLSACPELNERSSGRKVSVKSQGVAVQRSDIEASLPLPQAQKSKSIGRSREQTTRAQTRRRSKKNIATVILICCAPLAFNSSLQSLYDTRRPADMIATSINHQNYAKSLMPMHSTGSDSDSSLIDTAICIAIFCRKVYAHRLSCIGVTNE